MFDGVHLPKPILAIDIGGTKLEVGVVDSSGRLSERHRQPTVEAARRVDGARALFDQVASLVECLAPFDRFSGVGVGCGGPMRQMGEFVSPLNIRAWRDVPLRQQISELTGHAAVVDNDAKALALAEGWVGAARGVDNYLAMVVSTGVGAGIVLDGRLLEGDDGNAGHIGHVVVEPDGNELADHVRGVLEAEASGTAIAAHTGRPASEASLDVIDRTGVLVGRAVGSVANLLDLHLAVVAGSVALGFGTPFFAAAQREIDRVCQVQHARGARIAPAGCGDEGPLIGAAALALRSIAASP